MRAFQKRVYQTHIIYLMIQNKKTIAVTKAKKKKIKSSKMLTNRMNNVE